MAEHPDEFADSHEPTDGEAESFLPARDLPGAVLMIPNAHWSIRSNTSTDHPGACAHYLEARREGLVVSGTDAENPRGRRFLVIQPSPENGLAKPTAFNLAPRYFRLHRLKLYFPERHIGRLDGVTLVRLRDELARLNPEEG